MNKNVLNLTSRKQLKCKKFHGVNGRINDSVNKLIFDETLSCEYI